MKDKITVNAQSSIRIEAEKIIYFDPFKIATATNDADVIFITHDHPDHFSPEDIRKAQKTNTTFVIPKSMENTLKKPDIPISYFLRRVKRQPCMIFRWKRSPLITL